MKIAILGFGQEGKSILRFLRKSSDCRQAKITILDKKFSPDYLKNLEQFDLIFKSPGVPFNLPEIRKALKRGVKFSSATELFFQNAKCLIIGVTGTKGKGTTSTLIYRILKAAGKNIYLAGNIGKPALDLLPKLKNNSITILELSSFQLQNLSYSPNIAVVLEMFPDHLDAHKNFKEYVEAKANIARHQKKNDKIFYFAENQHSKWIAGQSPASKFNVIARPYILKIPGVHNAKNAAMAAAVANSFSIKSEVIKKIVLNFSGLEHRLELVRKIKNIKFYNDSASTNPQTAAAAIRAFPEPKILIAGGKDKNLNYVPLAQALKNSNTKLVVLFGENKLKIKKTIAKSRVPVKLAKNLKAAVYLALRSAIRNSRANYYIGATVLFSPGSASFDMFQNYKDRGEKFKKIVKSLENKYTG